jgi:hypothetical protein
MPNWFAEILNNDFVFTALGHERAFSLFERKRCCEGRSSGADTELNRLSGLSLRKATVHGALYSREDGDTILMPLSNYGYCVEDLQGRVVACVER